MTNGYLFPDEETLLVALNAGWIPEETSVAPATWQRYDVSPRTGQQTPNGLLVAPDQPLPAAARKQLRKAGIVCDIPFSKTVATNAVSCWPELVVPRPNRSAGIDSATVLFEMRPDDIAEVAAEILRLGCPRQELRMLPRRALIRAIEAPFFTIARALDRENGLHVFRGTGRVFVELGFDHPLAARIAVPADTILLIRGSGDWVFLPDGPFEDLGAYIDLQVPGAPRMLETAPDLPRIPIQLRLARASRHADATAFALPASDEMRLHAFLRTVPESVIDSMLFAVTKDPDRILLRARPGHVATSPFDTAEPFAAHPLVPQVLLPTASTLEPPVRREHLAELLAPRHGELAFVRPHETGGISVERVQESAFLPLHRYVDWIVDRAEALDTWKESATFSFNIALNADEPAPALDKKERERKDGGGGGGSGGGGGGGGGSIVEKKATRKRSSTAAELAVTPMPKPTEAAAALAEAEAAFLAIDGPPDDPARMPLFTRMGELLTALDRKREAVLCFNRVVWDGDELDAREAAARWVGGSAQKTLDAVLKVASPTADDARTFVAALAAGATGQPHALARWLERNADSLDVRSLWLGWLAISRLSGGDRLALARARDTILGRMSRGLSVERDVPTFLRFMHSGAGGLGRNADRLAKELEAFHGRLATASRSRSPVEAKAELTKAYQSMLVAYGLARLGAGDRAATLARQGSALLDAKDPVHGFLIAAFNARIAQAGEGSNSTALPPPVAAQLDGIERFLRYKVDRLRQGSTILEPMERLDPIAAFQKADADPRGDRFKGLRGMTDMRQLHASLERLLDAANIGSEHAERARIYDGVCDFLPELGESVAIPMLRRMHGATAGIDQLPLVALLGKMASVAGHFGDTTTVNQLVGDILPLIAAIDSGGASDIAEVVAHALRALRRVGLRDEASRLLQAVAAKATGGDIGHIVARVYVAGGLAYLGQHNEAQPGLTGAVEHIANNNAPVTDRVTLARALARAAGSLREEVAASVLRSMEEALPRITDSYNTNSHFCLSALHFTESIVLGYANEELAVGDLGRRYLDEDEHLIRRKIQRDLAQV